MISGRIYLRREQDTGLVYVKTTDILRQIQPTFNTIRTAINTLSSKYSAPVPTQETALDVLGATVIHVEVGGSNQTGNGSPERPFADPAFAESTITDAGPNKIYVVFCGAGLYEMSSWAKKPWVWVVGDTSTVNLKVQSGLCLSNQWTKHSQGGFVDLVLDHVNIYSLLGKISFQNVNVTTSLTIQGNSATLFWQGGNLTADQPMTITGVEGTLRNLYLTEDLTLATHDTVDLASCVFTKNLTLSPCAEDFAQEADVEGEEDGYPTVHLTGSRIDGILKVNQDLVLRSDVSSLPVQSKLEALGTVSLLNSAHGLGYTPSADAFWMGSVTTTQQALDRLSRQTGKSVFSTTNPDDKVRVAVGIADPANAVIFVTPTNRSALKGGVWVDSVDQNGFTIGVANPTSAGTINWLVTRQDN